MKREFIGKVALVTGSSKGIGKDIAIGLANHGADVIVNYFSDKDGALDTKCKVEAFGRQCIAVRADVGRFDDVKNMYEITYAKFGRVDILINNSAVAIWKAFEDFSEDDWDSTLNTNLKSIFLCSQMALPSMKKNKGGVIINIGSMGGHAYMNHLVPYCTSKGGVNLITKSLAVELAKYNIRVNCVSPGTIAVARNFNLDPDYPENWFPFIPQGKIGLLKEVTDPVIFLCSKEALHITGQIIYIDGGTTCYIPMPGSHHPKSVKGSRRKCL